uniref:Uncharacterized protein n=1 Tax=Panagrolaimus sp. ES5 TaxID=591445 RepID=A0AC34FFC8_9BILA
MPSSKRGGEMKRVQSEGGNLHINGLEDDEDDLYGSAGLNDIYGSYGNYIKIQKPVMGVKGSSAVTGKPPPPNYGSNNNGGTSSSPAIDFNENKVQLRPKKHGNEVRIFV